MPQLICGCAKTLAPNLFATLAARFGMENELVSDGTAAACRNSCNELNVSQK
jgi:hypothetical protein